MQGHPTACNGSWEGGKNKLLGEIREENGRGRR